MANPHRIGRGFLLPRVSIAQVRWRRQGGNGIKKGDRGGRFLGMGDELVKFRG
jgi:hypothetical protein